MGSPLFNRRRPSRSTSNAPKRTFIAVDHSCFQSVACQHFGQVQAIVMSAIVSKLPIGKQSPRIHGNDPGQVCKEIRRGYEIEIATGDDAVFPRRALYVGGCTASYNRDDRPAERDFHTYLPE